MITIDNTISFSIGAVIGYIIREVISDRLARSRALDAIRIEEFNKAAAKLRETFLPVRIALNPSEFAIKEDLSVFLKRHFQNFRQAVMEFSDLLDTQTKTAFLQAWHEYYRHPEALDKNYIPFSCQGLTIEQKHERMKHAQCCIEKILEFAKPK
ncbi:MAG: hypothetical protein JXB48_01025 [Candidatus Latescibacteria bacterium]|nr:hypothetical protein [Candidatus Latescibacterota bacterium]